MDSHHERVPHASRDQEFRGGRMGGARAVPGRLPDVELGGWAWLKLPAQPRDAEHRASGMGRARGLCGVGTLTYQRPNH